MTDDVRMALIGAGFIGKSHALAIGAVNRVFADCPRRAIAFVLAEADATRARAAAAALGFANWTASWEEAVDMADAVLIAVPSFLHRAIAERAIAQRKPVLCEKPVALSSADAAALARAAAASNIVNAVGFTYLRAPLVQQARLLLDSGRLGRPVHLLARHCEDYLADGAAPHSWRLSAATAGRCGALGDLGCHAISIARFLCGEITALTGMARTVHAERPSGGAMRAVENEDYAGALLRFGSGAVGVLETSRIAHGRKMDLSFELTCERGTLRFEGERFNELKLYVDGEDAAGAGFRTILANPAHPGFGAFLPAPGHGLSFNDLKTIEMNLFLRAIASGENVAPDLAEAARISRICESILDSSTSGRWIEFPERHAA